MGGQFQSPHSRFGLPAGAVRHSLGGVVAVPGTSERGYLARQSRRGPLVWPLDPLEFRLVSGPRWGQGSFLQHRTLAPAGASTRLKHTSLVFNPREPSRAYAPPIPLAAHCGNPRPGRLASRLDHWNRWRISSGDAGIHNNRIGTAADGDVCTRRARADVSGLSDRTGL